MAVVHKICGKCGRQLNETQFWKMKDGTRTDMCRDCLTQYVDNRDPQTFLWILKKFDVPYIERKWTEMVNKIYMKDPSKFGPASVVGRYIRAMNMKQYADYHFEDTDRLNNKEEMVRAMSNLQPVETLDEREQELLRQLEAGEISQAEYDTRTTTNRLQTPAATSFQFAPGIENTPTAYNGLAADPAKSQEEEPEVVANPIPVPAMISDSYWTDQLEDDDYKYLILKWGSMYTPEQWIKMEQMYQEYAADYDLNVDREAVLKKMCKTSLKMDEALDTGDLTGYKNLATVFDQLRKSGKFK